MKKLFLILVVWMFGTGLVLAHNPNEISYFFKFDTNELVVHLTPKSAIDILEKLHPELMHQNRFSLNSYTSDFESYFNKHIRILVDLETISLHLETTNLTAHDATLTFGLSNLPAKPENFDIMVSSFVDIYKRAKNHVFVYSGDIKKQYPLNATMQSISDSLHEAENTNSTSSILIFSASSLFMFLSIAFAVYRKQRPSLKPFQAS